MDGASTPAHEADYGFMKSNNRTRPDLTSRTVFQSWSFWIALWSLIALVAAAVACSLFWGWLSEGEAGSATIRNIILAFVAAIAMPIALWRSSVAANQLIVAQRSLLDERYQKGAEMLNATNLSARLGGVYSLQQLAQNSPSEYHIPVMRLFCAYFRRSISSRRPFGEPIAAPGEIVGETSLPTNQATERIISDEHTDQFFFKLMEDEQAIFDAFNSRSYSQLEAESNEDYMLDLSG